MGGLAGNKMDLDSKREVPKNEAQSYAQDNNCIFFETSAKTGENVNSIFTQIAKKLPKNVQQTGNDSIQIVPQDDGERGGCCIPDLKLDNVVIDRHCLCQKSRADRGLLKLEELVFDE